MKVRYTQDFTERERRAVNYVEGREGLATRAELLEYLRLGVIGILRIDVERLLGDEYGDEFG